ncbi:hypothetical protein Nepgr_022875 [Nepenthes gracilis]|uniref:Uncharacterized protein n=1 Tax=Nepenthes gracilis TaxID=150966 RepID=A0AAD3SZU8_NEPGR|nr:hypothetical protein Nepgr_022875 [Nepenthes gracilis]
MCAAPACPTTFADIAELLCTGSAAKIGLLKQECSGLSWIRIGLYAGLGVERSSASLWAHADAAVGYSNQCCSSNVDVLYLELLI